jgi:hypothetical protein
MNPASITVFQTFFFTQDDDRTVLVGDYALA